jgi:nucleoid-associated protein YgaU
MSARRLVLTAVSMGLIAMVLGALTPAAADMTGALTAPQQTVDTMGTDSLVIAAAGLLAWSVWAWGALGLALTAASALPGMLGGAARLATQVILPAGARRSAALVLGLGLGVAGPLAGVAVPVVASSALAAVPAAGVPDWPAAPAAAAAAAPVSDSVPDWPTDPSAVPDEGSHVVVRGDCLWHIAAARLLEQSGSTPTDGEVTRAVHAWWAANADVIGPDPDRLLTGQVLRPPGPT